MEKSNLNFGVTCVTKLLQMYLLIGITKLLFLQLHKYTNTNKYLMIIYHVDIEGLKNIGMTLRH